MKLNRLLLLIYLFPLLASAQVPTLVQHVSCPNSRNGGNQQSNTPDYKCPLPEPSQAGNAIIVGVTAVSTGAFTLSDDKSNAYTLATSTTDGNGMYIAIYVATNIASGTRMINLHRTTPNAFNVAMSASEYYNVALTSAIDEFNCTGSANGTSISAGSITPTVSGDLLWQWAINTGGGGGLPNSVTSFTVGSQPAVSWQLLGTDLHDGDAVQAGVYNATAQINPTFTSQSQSWSSCVVALKPPASGTTTGNAPTQAFRIVHMLHQQMAASGSNPFKLQFPASGNLIVASYISGGSLITSATSTPSNTWSSTGTAAGGQSITAASQIYYAANASTSNSMTISFTKDTNTSDGTYMMYDIVGAATSPFDKDSGPQSANQTSQVSSFSPSGVGLTPTGVSGGKEIVVGNTGWNWCTANGVASPVGALFDVATDTGNSVNGPEPVDQNNGWFHLYTVSTSALTTTWSPMACNQAEGLWAGRVAAFKSASSVAQQPAPPTQLNAAVN